MNATALKERTPALRFAGFDDDWKQRPFGDAFSERREKNTQENEDTLLSCAITGMFLNSELFGHFRGSTTIGYLRVKKNDLILSAQNLHLGNANVNLRFDHGIISPAYKVYDIVDCDPEFVQAWVKKEDTKDFFLAVTTEGASQCRKNIEWDVLDKQTISMPSKAEQERIGAAFDRLDRLIALHRRKVEKLTAAKKALLVKLFPSEGETVPAVRFAGFTGEWEQRKFSDQYEKVSEKNDLSFGADKIISVANMYYKTDTQKSDDDYMRTYNVMRLGDIAFEGHKSKSYSNGRFVENTIGDGIVSHVFDVFRPIREYDLLFWKYLINDEHIMGEILARCTKSTTMMMSLVASDFLKEATLVPSKSEQEKIGAAFEKLDRLIALHRRKVEKLTDAKKALLNKMFPKNKDAGAQIGRDF